MLPEVRDTTEFRRVRDLPRRRVTQADADAWAAVLTPDFLCDKAPTDARIRDWQGYGIAEAVENHGAWLAYPVGIGKTLYSALIARAMRAERPMLALPASLRDKTYSDFSSYRGTWRMPEPPPRITTFHELNGDGGARLLRTMRPDLIIVDEGDELANIGKGTPRLIDRYVCDAQDDVAIIVMSGSPSRKSMMGYWHQLRWVLRDDNAPVPCNIEEARMWAAAIDDLGTRVVRRPGPGPLGRTVKEARAWFKRRLAETPGVVIVDLDSAGAVPLRIDVRLAKEDAVLDRHFEKFALERENPAGIPVAAPLDAWRTDGQLGTGLFTKYKDPQPPQPWRDARRAVAKFVREEIDASTYTTRPLDTEGQVLRRHVDEPVVADWLAIEPTYVPHTEAVWVSTSMLETVIAWLGESSDPGAVWCGGVDFAEALASLTRLSYFSNKGQDQHGRGLHIADPRKSMIVSWHANKKGFNLQAWRRIAIVQPPQSAKWLEQLMGRHHRSGQDREVHVTLFATSGGTLDGFAAALSEASFAKDSVGLTQKILRANITIERPVITQSNRFRWATRGSGAE